jgi:hypothetical protein
MRLNHTRGASMGRVDDTSLVPPHDVYQNHYRSRRVKVIRRAVSYWCTGPTAAWEQDPKRHKFRGGSTPACGCQPGRIWNWLVPRRPEELCET